MTRDEALSEYKRIHKILLFTRDDPETQGALMTGEAIEHEGKLWLVICWLDHTDQAISVPARLVCLSEPPAVARRLQKSQLPNADYTLNHPIPIAALRLEKDPQTGDEFVVLDRPNLRVRRPH